MQLRNYSKKQKGNFFIIFFTIIVAALYVGFVMYFDNDDNTHFTELLNAWWFLWAPTCVGFWLSTCLMDLLYTIRRASRYVAQYEKSPILRHVLSVVTRVGIHFTIWRQKQSLDSHHKYTIQLSKPVLFVPTILITLTIEACIVLAAPLVVWPHVWNLQLFYLVGVICGIAHLSGLVQTRRFVRDHK